MSLLDANGAIACAECGRLSRAVRDRLKAENEKLRELVRDLWSIGFSPYSGVNSAQEYAMEVERLLGRMAELGIEVDE